MWWTRKTRQENRTSRPGRIVDFFNSDGIGPSLAITGLFFACALAILLLREEVVRYRPGQYVTHDIVARVEFTYHDEYLLTQARERSREMQPRVYTRNEATWTGLQELLEGLPEKVAESPSLKELPPDLASVLDDASLTQLQDYATADNLPRYKDRIGQYISSLQQWNPIIIPEDQRQADLGRRIQALPAIDPIATEQTHSTAITEEFTNRLSGRIAEMFRVELQPKILTISVNYLREHPTHKLDAEQTTQARNREVQNVPPSAGNKRFLALQPIVAAGQIQDRDWQILKAENKAYIESLDQNAWKSRLGTAGIVALITILLAGYVWSYQARIVKNHARALAIVALMISMLLLAQVAAIGHSPLLLFGVAPTILTAFILAIAYDRRFAIGISTIHAILVTLGLGEGMGFFLILWTGVMTACFLLDDLRTRSKLIEVSGATALAMIAASLATGALSLDPLKYTLVNSLWVGAAGLAVGFVVLGILPIIEKWFRITTSMTLLELADASHPLLKRLQIEAPGTYNHSLQVATLSEIAAEGIGANSLLCRVASYYHDVGKIKKSEYFVENQSNGENRHLNLSPSVSLLIIIGHVKDGIELAREYNLPTSIFPFIQQHHGTTLVEYFYHAAMTTRTKDPRQADQPAISEMQYRYPGPKPRSREVAVVMIADAVESACRSMVEPTAARIEMLVHELIMKRLLDHQFDDCDLTMREIEVIEKALVKTLLAIYHGRIPYPSTQSTQQPTTIAAPTAKTA